jgi:cobalt-zinc-cadmium efflux system membrane fusion protein
MNNPLKYFLLLTTCLSMPAMNLSGQAGTHYHDEVNETCFICDESKRDPGRLWCRGHDCYEDRCWLCHPELEDKGRPYCQEHSLYEDECFLCHPELNEHSCEDDHSGHGHASHEEEDDHAGHGHSTRGGQLWCNEHGVAEIECGICQPQLAANLATGEGLKIRMPSVESADKAGIQTGTPLAQEAQPLVEAFCETQYNLNALAKVTPLAHGVLVSVRKDVGNAVKAGDVLAELHSAEIAVAKAEFLSASVRADISGKAYEREKRLKDRNIASEKEFLEAEAAYHFARLAASNGRQQLVTLGMTVDEIQQVLESEEATATLLVRAPFDGTIVERDAVMGEAVESGKPLFVVADLSTYWLELSIPADHAGNIRTGQVVRAEFPDLPGEVITGHISWVDTSVDMKTRMIRARAMVNEPGGLLLKGLFGRAGISTGQARPMSLIPGSAVQKHEGETFVFVQEEQDLFSLRRVEVGESVGDRVEILEGITSGDSVVVTGTFVVMSEFLKSRLGAGCAGH